MCTITAYLHYCLFKREILIIPILEQRVFFVEPEDEDKYNMFLTK